jgi:hypothetical protein
MLLTGLASHSSDLTGMIGEDRKAYVSTTVVSITLSQVFVPLAV